MKNKEILVNENGLKGSIISGMYKVFAPVSKTLGSHGKYSVIERGNGEYSFTKDGVSIAREIKLPNKVEDAFAKAIIDGSNTTLRLIGDGTTSTIILTYFLVKNILESEGVKNFRDFNDGLDQAMLDFKKIHSDMKSQSEVSLNDLIAIATTSSNGDEEMGRTIGTVYNKVGVDGEINIKYHEDKNMKVEYVDGYIVDEGLLATEFINGRGMCTLNNPYILITNGEIKDADKFLNKVMEWVLDNGESKEMLVIASGFSREVIATMLKNWDDVKICPIKTPSIGDMKNAYLEDLAFITGSKFINAELDQSWEDELIYDVISTVPKVEVKMGETVIHLGSIDEQKKEEYLKSIKELAEDKENDYSEEFVNKRISKINGSIASIFMKNSTISEMSFDYDRIDDSLKATKNAMKNGVLPGFGKFYLYCHGKMEKMNADREGGSSDFRKGYDAFVNTLTSITTVNLINSNHNKEQIRDIIHKCKISQFDTIYDTKKGEYGFYTTLGIMESYMSPLICMENAYSVAKMTTNTGSAITLEPELFS